MFSWFNQLQFSVEDVKCVLSQRGPDSVGEKKNFLQPKLPTCAQESVSGEGTCNLENATTSGELHFIGSTLQLRGTSPIIQPLVDSSGNILAYNGVVFFFRLSCFGYIFVLKFYDINW